MVILGFIFGVVITLVVLGVVAYYKGPQPENKVHFYIARDRDKSLWLYMGEPIRGNDGYFTVNSYGKTIWNSPHFKDFGLNEDNYKDLKWEDEPVEVFLNMED